MEDSKLNIIDNPKVWRNVRGIAFAIVLLVAPLIYFGSNNIDIDSIINYEFGGLIIFMTFSNLIAVFESRTRAFEDELDYDKTIVDMEIEFEKKAELIRKDIPKGVKGLSKYNKELQESYDLQKTTLKIDKLKIKYDKCVVKFEYTSLEMYKNLLERKKQRIENKIHKLNKVSIRDKRFRPYKFNRLINSDNIGKYKRVGNSEINSNPKKIPILGAIIKMPIKGFGMSLGGMFLMLLIVDDKEALAKFYGWYILIIGITIILQYILTRLKTKYQYKRSLIRKLKLQDIVLEEINKKVELVETPLLEIKRPSL